MGIYFEKRNKKITRRVLAGETLKVLAGDYKISEPRVRVIVIETLTKAMKSQTSFMVKVIGLRKWRELYKTHRVVNWHFSRMTLW